MLMNLSQLWMPFTKQAHLMTWRTNLHGTSAFLRTDGGWMAWKRYDGNNRGRKMKTGRGNWWVNSKRWWKWQEYALKQTKMQRSRRACNTVVSDHISEELLDKRRTCRKLWKQRVFCMCTPAECIVLCLIAYSRTIGRLLSPCLDVLWGCCVPVPRQVGGAVGPQPRQQRVVGVVENLLGVTLSLEVTEQ